MDPRDLKKILDALSDAEFSEFSLKTSEYEISLKRGAEQVLVQAPVQTVAAPQPVVVQQPAVQAPVVQSAPAAQPVAESAPAAQAAPAEDTSKLVPVKAPIVGTFYSSSSPDATPYVQVGDRVQVGQVLCIVEAMKLMNEIESEVAGIVRKILVNNAQPVEYGQDLFLIEPA
ncbi:acetyl-CoA carboxylase biotin carboxyl carrier protein [Deinococcus misasensis]|uniref:acetyl-CoA carboxylase biotin carboxyl carrier protein n=1 Tax=Deinococcus misasensis TaxID=392413 RepID=UPI000559988E|nr:acetyl-CoA carboxylase biotin carboxyl carrier protein [Deinococcus misasensis]